MPAPTHSPSGLDVTPASVTGMVQKLACCQARAGRLSKASRRDADREGEQAALEVIRHHRLLEDLAGTKRSAIPGTKCTQRQNGWSTSSRRISNSASPQRWAIRLRDPHGEPHPHRRSKNASGRVNLAGDVPPRRSKSKGPSPFGSWTTTCSVTLKVAGWFLAQE